MSLTQFNTWLLLCVLQPLGALVLGSKCTDGQTRFQTCNNNTWCSTNLLSELSRSRQSSSCLRLCLDIRSECRDQCSDGRLLCQHDEISPIATAKQNITVTSTAIVTQTRPRILRTRTVTTLVTQYVEVTRSCSSVTCTSCPATVSLSPSPSQTPVSTVTQDGPNTSTNTNEGYVTTAVSMATMGVVTGILLVSLVMVIAGWVWTCVRMRSHSPSNDNTNNTESDIEVKPNQVYGIMTRGEMSEPDGENVYENL